MNIIKSLAAELAIKEEQVGAVLTLLDEGNTIPFIARYRKEKTGSLDDTTLRNLFERLTYLRSLEERRQVIVASLKEQGVYSPELAEQLEAANKLTELETIYRPYKKKKKTRAVIAKEAGLLPLSSYIKKQEGTLGGLTDYAATFINIEKGVLTAEDALQGASDIIAEELSDAPSNYEAAKAYILKSGSLASKETKEDVEGTFATYKAFSCPVLRIRNYQVLALNRGENEKKLSVSFQYDHLTIPHQMARGLLKPNSPFYDLIEAIALDSFKRLLAPSVETEIRSDLFLKAEDASIVLFKANLKQLLLAAPLKGKRILGFDPAFVNGCKLAAIDEFGKLLEVGVIYPTIGGAQKILESERIILSFISRWKIDYIALGNGTASRESEAFLNNVLQKNGLSLPIVIVNEAGASVYSASPLGASEFPELSVEKRSAISLARRLLDPLSELVKIEPEAIGVGQYQHDMDKKKLSMALSGVVEDAVNEVGVDVNAASPSLLSYVSGIGPSLAAAIVSFREANGPFRRRTALQKVPKLGPKAYKQCAGFLRIQDGEPLDNTGVHPESYEAARGLLRKLGLGESDLGTPKARSLLSAKLDLASLAAELGVGIATLEDIVKELSTPGRDPRLEAKSATLSLEAIDIKDLKPGQILAGTVRNIMDFGVFVDIGVHQDGLVHISEMADHFVSSPAAIVKIGDIVKVKVLSVDLARKRISLSMKGLNS